MTPREEIGRHLALLLGHVVLEPGEHFALKLQHARHASVLRMFYARSLDQLVDLALRLRTQGDVYAAVGFRRCPEALDIRRCPHITLPAWPLGAGHVSRVGAVRADYDVGTPTGSATLEEALTLVDRLRPEPPIILASGTGLNLQWTLDPPLTPAELAAHGPAINIGNGIIRLPKAFTRIAGTLNHKYVPPRPVRLLRPEVPC